MRQLILANAALIFSVTLYAQTTPSNMPSNTTACTFEDGKQISVRYNPQGPAGQKELPHGEMWPAGSPEMYLFTQSDVSIAHSEIAVGAYSLYVIPEKKQWTLIINKGVTKGEAYKQEQDVVRATLETGHLGQAAKKIQIAFGHIAPKQCNLRIYYGETGAWAEFKEK